ncbi:MAG: phosphotransferase, partial [bacterium]
MTTTEQKSRPILEMTSNMQFTVGTNLTGGLASAAWRVLLPGLELSHILFLGKPKNATLQVFADLSKQVSVVAEQGERLEIDNADSNGKHAPALAAISLRNGEIVPLEDRTVDLIVVNHNKYLELIARREVFAAECSRVLSDAGVVYFEARRQTGSAILSNIRKAGLSESAAFWLTPFKGEMRTAFPAGDSKMAAYLFQNVLFGQSFKKKTLSRGGVLLSKMHLLPAIAPRRAVLVKKSKAPFDLQEAPKYILDLADENGVDFRGLRCGLSARGKFNANKSIFYLFEKDASEAKYVAKMTRAPEFNFRLENEFRSLSHIRAKGYVDEKTYPVPLFFGHHAGLVVSAQKAVHAQPFRTRTLATADCPIMHDAIDWIIELGIASADESCVAGEQVARVLSKLFTRFREIYHLPAGEIRFLAEQIKMLESSTAPFPLVFQHGDLGSWNILVGSDNKVIVLDWEAGETGGMPLWDFFYFIRSYAMWMCRVKGRRDSLKNFDAMFLQPSEISGVFANTIAKYCMQIGLDKSLIAPLFYTCWMHRSLKEAMRLKRDELMSGHYVSLLRMCIERWDEVRKAL